MSKAAPAAEISPRSVADKRVKRNLLAAIRMALRVQSPAVRHNTQTFNRNRYAATAELADYDEMKDRARAIKEHAIEHLPELLTTLAASVQRNGGHFFLAADAQEACGYVRSVCRDAHIHRVVKGKSMTSEEVGLNHALAEDGIEVTETDLAEFILQVADEQPSHIIAPAIHYSRERITALFQRVFRTSERLDTGEDLTRFAREQLREKFLRADAGITGANFVAADTGTLVLVESEANIRMAALLPRVHIAISGIEKVVPTRADFAPFIELLAASATGQGLSSYTSILQPPLHDAPLASTQDPRPREFHLVLIDNGRRRMRDDPVLREALYCVRCSACLNSCANFQTVGGHAFGGETYSGGIGGAWEAGTHSLQHARFSELCTGCTRCLPQCPVRIDVPWINTVLRSRLAEPEAPPHAPLAAAASESSTPLQKRFFGRFDVAGKWGSRFAAVTNAIGKLGVTRLVLEKTVGADRRRPLPVFAERTLVDAWPHSHVTSHEGAAKAALFADIFTNYNSPERGLATGKVLRALGVNLQISIPSPDGRAAFSQGMLVTAATQARATAALLRQHTDEGCDVIVVEPSVLAMFRLDYRHLLDRADERELVEALRARAFDPAEYAWRVVESQRLDAARIFPAARHPKGVKIFLHSHCQQKTIGAAVPTEKLLRAAGFDVVTSQVECCGMAGSFGYKKEFYELSMAVGEDLFAQVRRAEADGGPRILVAAGTSCVEQLHAGFGRPVFHPMELLAEVMQTG